MNSKAEFKRCHIPRLVVEVENEEKSKEIIDREQKNKEEMEIMLEDMEGLKVE